MGEASVKVEGGKMVNIKIDESGLSFTGDFFIEPAEAREEIEEALGVLDRDSSNKEIVKAVLEVDAKLIGFSAEHVAEAFRKAVGGGSS